MTPSCLALLVVALSSVLCAAAAPYDGYTQVVVPQKRAALLLDRLLIALQKALQDGEWEDGARTAPLRLSVLNDDKVMGAGGAGDDAAPELLLHDFHEPRTAPLRIASIADTTSTLQRRGQGGGGGGRVVRCFFNAVTCF